MDDPDGYFGEPVAASYDDPLDRMFQPEAIDPAVSLLAELAGSGRALELAIGTGRVGLPLSQRGVPVQGIELSRAMAARLRGKPGGEAISVTIGDMATTRVDGTFTVAYLVYNTINNLTSQEAQLVGGMPLDAAVRALRDRLHGRRGRRAGPNARHQPWWPYFCVDHLTDLGIPQLKRLVAGAVSGLPRLSAICARHLSVRPEALS